MKYDTPFLKFIFFIFLFFIVINGKSSNNIIKKKIIIGRSVRSKKMMTEKKSNIDSFLYKSYNKNAIFADSIQKINKSWVDSVLKHIPKNKPVTINPSDQIEIFVSGGGLIKGVNPKYDDRLMIFPSGYVYRTYRTKLQGSQVITKSIDKDKLLNLAEFIVKQDFFTFERKYDCNTSDVACKARLDSDPEAIPLTISVTIGSRKNRVYISFFAPKMEPNYVNYPPQIEKIMEAIYSTIE